jgi:hypothetical protein
MRDKLCGILLVVSIGAAGSAACAHWQPSASGQTVVHESARVRHTEGPIDVTSTVVDLTLEQFWRLASLQVRDPSSASRLLESDPRNPSKALDPLKVGFEAYRLQLGKVAQVRPVILFLKHGADPEEEARRHGLAIAPWPRQTPPAFLSGPVVDVLVLFDPEKSAREDLRRGGPVARARIASVTGWFNLLSAEEAPSDPIGLRLYQVQPRTWKKGVVFEHTRCMARSPDVQLVTKLTYQGSVTDSNPATLTDANWGPCALSTDSKLRAAIVKQPSSRKAGRPVIIAGSYYMAPEPGLFLSDWIAVK